MGELALVALRFFIMECGEQFVMTDGIIMTLKLFVENLVLTDLQVA